MTRIIQLDIFNPESAIKELEAYKESIKRKTDLLVKRLGELGMEQAKVEFTIAGAKSDYDNDVTVDVVFTDKGATISAKGTEVLFIEFGAGLAFNAYPSEHPMGAELGYIIGEYGRGKGMHPPWRDVTQSGKTIFTWGNPAGKCMYLTSKELRHKLTIIAKEVFSIK